MTVDSSLLATDVATHLKNLDAYLLGHHERQVRELICSLENKPNLTPRQIANLITKSPLPCYRILKASDREEPTEWKLFNSQQTFDQFRQQQPVQVLYLSRSRCNRIERAIFERCIVWCRRVVIRSVDSTELNVRYAMV